MEEKIMSNYQRCSRCVMDTTALDISFGADGTCSYCTAYYHRIKKLFANETEKQRQLQELLAVIKGEGAKKEYDCVVGVSGGLDSSYVLYVAVKLLGLRPLAVHVDNAWNSELSVHNVEKLCKGLGVDLYNYVIDWEEFKSLQLAFFKANVIDIEMLTDHAVISVLYKTAAEKKIRYILAGTNVANEGVTVPPMWVHAKIDSKNIRAIFNKCGNGMAIKTFPFMGLFRYLAYMFLNKITWVSILNYLPFDKNEAIRILSQEVGWQSYEKKHYESVFTRFYQGYILPQKFKVDKRTLHFSSLICSGQMSRAAALEELKKPTYEDRWVLEEDKTYVLKKLGFSEHEFEEYLSAVPVPHNKFASDQWLLDNLALVKKLINRRK